MSKITVSLPQQPLQWWRLRLPQNEDGHLYTQGLDDAENPTQMVMTFFDGEDTELAESDFVAAAVDSEWTTSYLYLLTRGGRPTPAKGWVPVGDPVELAPPSWSTF